jgi:RND family efflux transporter MFP subunit
MQKNVICLLAALSLLVSCSGKKAQANAGEDNETQAASMRQLYARQGTPVSTRELKPRNFSVYLDYPSVLEASSQATAYAGLTDVVRAISVKVGDQVKRDQVIVSFSDDNPRLLQAQAAYNGAQTAYRRIVALYRTHDVSRQQYDQTRSQYDQAAAALKAMNDMIYVKAPIDGYVTQLNARLNQNAQAGSSLFTVTNSGGYEAKFYVSPDEINRIAAGERVYINNPPAPGKAAALEGRITQVAYTMDSQRQAFQITASFSTNGGAADLNALAKQGYYAGKWIDAVVEVYNNPNALVLSRTEMAQNEDGTWGAYLDIDGKARLMPVSVGQTSGLEMEITSGLKSGDTLISEGASMVQDGDRLNVVPGLLLKEKLADAGGNTAR